MIAPAYPTLAEIAADSTTAMRAAPSFRPGASQAAAELVELYARLRLACAALGVQPEDVRIPDLAPSEQRRLRAEGREDFWAWVSGER